MNGSKYFVTFMFTFALTLKHWLQFEDQHEFEDIGISQNMIELDWWQSE